MWAMPSHRGEYDDGRCPPYRDRIEAGRALVGHMKQYKPGDAIVFAIPRGGIPVAVEVAKKLGSELDVIVSRKIPIPDNTEAGYGAVTEDGAIVLNEPLVERLRLTRQHERHVTRSERRYGDGKRYTGLK